MLGDLSEDVIRIIFSFLATAPALSMLSRVNRRLGEISNDFELWHRVYSFQFGVEEKTAEEHFARLSLEDKQKNWKVICMKKKKKKSRALLEKFVNMYKKEVTLGGKLPNMQRVEKAMGLRFEITVNGKKVELAWKQPKVGVFAYTHFCRLFPFLSPSSGTSTRFF